MSASEVTAVTEVAANTRTTDNRSYLRLRMPVTVSGVDSYGRNFAQNATTVLISRSGAALECVTPLPVEAEVVVRVGPREAVAKVVGQTRVRGVQALYAVSLLLEESAFWGVYFPDRGARTINEKALQCVRCETTRLTLLDDMELLVLENDRRLRLFCESCQVITERKLMTLSSGAVSRTESVAMSTLARKLDERRWTRITVPDGKACVKGNGSEEIVSLANISRGGACFRSARQYPLGTQLQIAAPYSDQGQASFLDARVLRISKDEDAREYALEFL